MTTIEAPPGGGEDAGDEERPTDPTEADWRFVYIVAFGVLRNVEDAKDAAGETFLALVEARARGHEIRCVHGWLARVAKNRALTVVRQRQRRPAVRLEGMEEVGDLPAARGGDPEDQAIAQDLERQILDRASERLSPQALSVLPYWWDGCDNRQIAEKLGLKCRTAGRRVLRLKRVIEDIVNELTKDQGLPL